MRCLLATALLAAACTPTEPSPRVVGGGEASMEASAEDRAFVLALPRRGPPVVDVVVPGAGAARFLVDTGGEFTWIDRDFVRRHSIPTEPVNVTLTDANGNVARVRDAAAIDTLGFDGTELTGLRPLVLDSIHRGVDGALGQDFLRSFLTVFDGPGRRLILWYGDRLVDDLEGAFRTVGRTHEHEVDWSAGIPRIRAHVPALGRHLPFVIDTGSDHNTLPAEAIDELAPRRVGTFVPVGLAGRAETVGLYEVDRLQVENLLVSGLLTQTPNPSLGWDTLRTVVVVFENATGTLFLLPEATLHADWPPR